MVWARQKMRRIYFCLFSFPLQKWEGLSQPLSSRYRKESSFATPFCCAPSKKYYLADHIIDHNKAMVPGMGADSPATGPGTCARSTARSGLGGRFVTGTDSVRWPECCRDEESLLQQDSCKAESRTESVPVTNRPPSLERAVERAHVPGPVAGESAPPATMWPVQ